MKVEDNRHRHNPKKIALVTGGFDPIHSGHIQYLKAAATYADYLIVGVNSDEWLIRKKGKPFMPLDERVAILQEMLVVDEVITFDDDDNTACGAIEKVKELYKDKFVGNFHKHIIFCNGGDRTADNIPEQDRYKDDKWVSFEFGVGGENKKNSSSWILEDYRNAKTERNWGYYRVIHQIGKEVKVKELVIEPGQALSNQYHDKRNELWYVMKGEVVMNGVVQKEHGPAFLIPKGYWHHAKNISDKPCHILECQYGEECTEDDIHRQPLNENEPQQVNENESQYSRGTYIGLHRGQEDDGYPD